MPSFVQSLTEMALLGAAVTFVCGLAAKKVKAKDSTRLPLKKLLITTTVLWVVFLTLGLAGFPSGLATTHPDVVLHKANMRAMCHQALNVDLDTAAAENYVRDNVVGKALAAKQPQRRTIASAAFSVFNTVIFGMGAMFAVLPHLVLMGLDVAGVKVVSDTTWSKLVPMLKVITLFTSAVYLVFHLCVDQLRVNWCVLISGHWFTYVMTSFATIYTLVQIFASVDKTSGWRQYYPCYAVFHQLVSLRILHQTQTYFHDSVEGVCGIYLALASLPFILIFIFITEVSRYGEKLNEEHTLVTKISTLKAQVEGHQPLPSTSAPPAPPLPADLSPSSPMPASTSAPPPPPPPMETLLAAIPSEPRLRVTRSGGTPKPPLPQQSTSGRTDLMAEIRNCELKLRTVRKEIDEDRKAMKCDSFMGSLAVRLAERRRNTAPVEDGPISEVDDSEWKEE